MVQNGYTMGKAMFSNEYSSRPKNDNESDLKDKSTWLLDLLDMKQKVKGLWLHL